MKRLMLFAGSDYYPKGGSGDLLNDFDTIEEVNSYLTEILPNFKNITGSIYDFIDGGWAECFDTETKKGLFIYREEIIGFNWRDPDDPYFSLSLEEIEELKIKLAKYEK